MDWTSLTLTFLAAIAAGALSVPASRRLFLGEVSYDWLQNELELDCIEPDGATIRSKGGRLSRVWRIRGLSYDARVETEQNAMAMTRASLLRDLGREGLTLRLTGLKRQRAADFPARWPSPVLREIGEREAGIFRESYYLDWFLMASARDTRSLVVAHEKILSVLSDYAPEALTLSGDVWTPCPLTGFLAGLLSGEYRDDMPPLSRALSGTLPQSDVNCEKRTGTIMTRIPGQKLHRIITVNLWPETVSGQMIADILAIPGDIEIAQICEPWDRDRATVLYKRRQIGEVNALFGNPAAATEIHALLSLLAEDEIVIFATQFQFILRADDEEALDRLERAMRAILGRRRILHKVQDAGAPSCWFARLPEGGRRRRSLMPGAQLMAPLDLTDRNIAALWSFPHSASGRTSSQFGAAPVRMLRTPSGQTYSFQFQADAKPQSRGNYLVFAPTGGGKSTLMMYLLGGLAKFPGVRSYIFDSKEGTRFMVEAMGGVYQSYDTLALNPFDVGEKTPASQNRVYTILRAMAGDMALEPEDEEALVNATELAFSLEPHVKTPSAIFPFAFQKRTRLRKVFGKWVIDEKGRRGLHHHVFNAPRDNLSGFLDHFMVAINMNEALDDADLGPPIVAHIASAIGESAAKASKGFVIFIDEAAKLLQNPGFRALAVEMFREYRKLNGAVGLAFQDPAALTRAGHAEAFIENTATFIFLPNAQARPESFEAFNLNEEQLAFVCGRSGLGMGKRRALIIQRDAATGFDESAIVDVDLSPLGETLRFFRSGVDANRHLAELKQERGDKWHAYI